MKGFTKKHRHIVMVFLGTLVMVSILIVCDQSMKVVSVLLGILSITVSLVYTSIAYYRCFVLLTNASKATSAHIHANTSSYESIARFALSVSCMYGMGHVCQSVMYVSSVFSPQFYAAHFHLFEVLFKWADTYAHTHGIHDLLIASICEKHS